MVGHPPALWPAPADKRLAAVVSRDVDVLALPPGRGPEFAIAQHVEDAPTLAHLTADLHGIKSGVLRDSALLSGLLIAGASAGGLNATSPPIVRVLGDGGIAAILPTDSCHVSVYSFPARGTALLDVIAGDETTASKVLDVFVRRLVPADVTRETRTRGG